MLEMEDTWHLSTAMHVKCYLIMEMLTTLLWRLYIDQYVVRARIHPRIGSASLVSLLGHQ